ncbi:hypothetical protein J0H58_17280 [bacterium]|nr:hypothetical protein [bacterium]
MVAVAKACVAGLRTGLLAALLAWIAAAPVLWILRDGLGPDAVDTAGGRALGRFAVVWGLPALAFGVSVLGLTLAQRKLGSDVLTGIDVATIEATRRG